MRGKSKIRGIYRISHIFLSIVILAHTVILAYTVIPARTVIPAKAPSFPRKRESRAPLPMAALPLPNLMDSRFRGNDGVRGCRIRYNSLQCVTNCYINSTNYAIPNACFVVDSRKYLQLQFANPLFRSCRSFARGKIRSLCAGRRNFEFHANSTEVAPQWGSSGIPVKFYGGP